MREKLVRLLLEHLELAHTMWTQLTVVDDQPLKSRRISQRWHKNIRVSWKVLMQIVS